MSNNLNDPFHPERGEFAKNIRAELPPDDTELRESLRGLGWVKQFPAIRDEHKVVLVGHRRLKIAEELGIKPVIETITLGKGDEADAERLKIAIASNIGHKPLTPKDRQHIAQHLYGTKEWTMERIAKALNVSQQTISLDLANLPTIGKLKPVKTATNPKGAGRPKSSGKPKPTKKPGVKQAQVSVDAHPESWRQFKRKATAEGKTAAQKLGELVDPEIDLASLSMSAQEKLEAAIRQQTRRLEAEFAERARVEAQKLIEETILPAYNEERRIWREVIKSRKGIMDRATFKKIWKCLHPDWQPDPDRKKMNEVAFDLFSKLETVLLDEKENPTNLPPLPRSYADLMKMRAATTEARRTKRPVKIV